MSLLIAAVLLFVLDALLEKKDLISSDGISYHSNRDISSVRHTAPSLALGGICNSFWSLPLYDHIHDALGMLDSIQNRQTGIIRLIPPQNMRKVPTSDYKLYIPWARENTANNIYP